MEFKFKRKYTKFFVIGLVLHALILAFWLFFPLSILKSQKLKENITFLSIANIEIILLFYIGLSRKKYYAYYDKLFVKRSFFPNTTINYKEIIKIKDRPNDSILLGFGIRPSFVIYYKKNSNITRRKIIRCDNSELLLKVIKNEIDITKINNTNS